MLFHFLGRREMQSSECGGKRDIRRLYHRVPQRITEVCVLLPAAGCLNPLQRIPIDFEQQSLQGKLSEFSDRENVIVVIEGVWFYLTHAERQATLTALASAFPKHLLICDLMSKYFFEKLAKPIHKKLVDLGTTFRDVEEYPHERILAAGYGLLERKSMIKTARALGLNGIKGMVTHLMPEKLQMGYSVYRFQYGVGH